MQIAPNTRPLCAFGSQGPGDLGFVVVAQLARLPSEYCFTRWLGDRRGAFGRGVRGVLYTPSLKKGAKGEA